jgi:hypothetical protein
MVAQVHMHWLIQNKLGCQQQQPTGKYVTVAKRKNNMLTPSIGIPKRWIWNKVVLARILQYKFYNLLAICQRQIFFQEPLVSDCVWIIYNENKNECNRCIR